MPLQIHTAPPSSKGEVALGKTLPAFLDEAVERHPNPKAFNQPDGSGWRTMSNAAMREAADEVAVGLLESGVERGDRMAFFMNSDLFFQMMDYATLVAGIVNVPLYTTYSADNLVYVTEHAEAKAMAVSNREMLEQFAGWADRVPEVKLVVLAEGSVEGVKLPDGVRALTLDELRQVGRDAIAAAPGRPAELRDKLDAKDLATLIYTSGTTGRPKGVMLTHENISSNAITALTGFGVLGHQEEVVLNFLPMTHIYARTLTLANAGFGHSLFYSDPDRLVSDLPAVKPTFFATVPRVLEKVFDKVALGIQEAEGAKKKIGAWALDLAVNYDVRNPPTGLASIKHALADKLVYSKLRDKLGLVRIKAVTSGGAALRADLARAFNGFGIPVYEGYGLTETSPVIANNIPGANTPGTVGPPISGVEVAIAEDGEILTRGPHVMQGYYKAPDKTAEVMDDEGWFHTGDIGEFTPDGFLKITDRKKALFKLSTGKYVIPQPIENELTESPLIEQAVVVGTGEKFCTALIFPNVEAVRIWAKTNGLDASASDEALLKEQRVVGEFERLVDEANTGMDHWSQVKRFRLVPELMTVENGLLTPTMKVKRRAVHEAHDAGIRGMYSGAAVPSAHGASAVTA